MEPVVFGIDPDAGLVMMKDGLGLQLLVQSPLEGLESFRAPGEHRREGAGADRLAEEIGLAETVERNQLVHVHVDGEG
jgi:hypothetical protein